MAIIPRTVAAAAMAEHSRTPRGPAPFSAPHLSGSTSLGITRVPAADPAKKFRLNFFADLWNRMRAIRGDRPLVLAVVGNSYFFFLAALLQLNLFFYASGVLHVSETKIGLLSVALALGIGLGSVVAGYLSGGKIEYGLVPLGALGLSLASTSLAVSGLTENTVRILLALLGFSGGFFIVPIAALLQHRPEKTRKGELLATANLLSFVGVFLASGAHYLLAQVLQLSPRHIFLFGGVLTLAGAIYALFLLPDALLRFVLWVLTNSIYRIRVMGRDNIPERGGALPGNHVSRVDALLLLASTDWRVRLMMPVRSYEQPFLNRSARLLGVIPIRPNNGRAN
jgi:acyl-[acyl-carrier-protein]-phospholipid O-acyltransferase/long-chain-fatty-acid--[acyl-carrier-protein] ligase